MHRQGHRLLVLSRLVFVCFVFVGSFTCLYLGLSSPALRRLVLSCLVLSCPVLPCRVLRCDFVFCVSSLIRSFFQPCRSVAISVLNGSFYASSRIRPFSRRCRCAAILYVEWSFMSRLSFVLFSTLSLRCSFFF